MDSAKEAHEPLLATRPSLEKPELEQIYDQQTQVTKSSSRSKFSTRIAGVVAFFLVVVLPLAVYVVNPFQAKLEDVIVGLSAEEADDLVGMCPSPDPLPVKAPKKNIWRNLKREEALSIRKWLWEPEQGFNLTKGALAIESDNHIFLIESFVPKKGEALAYLDGSAEKPAKYAHAVIHHGSKEEIVDYLIGPLSIDHTISPNTTIRPLTDIYHYPTIPFSSGRHFLGNGTQLSQFFKRTFSPLENVTIDLFGVSAKGLKTDTLIGGGTSPMSYDGTWRRFWMNMKMAVPGFFLHPLDLYLYVDVTGTDESLWHVITIVYNNQVFKSVEEFKSAWEADKLVKSPKPNKEDYDWSTRTRKGKGEPRDLDDRAGPRQVSFNGPRMRLDKEEDYITWMGWSFYLGFERDMGLNLWDINFRGERIIYEISPQEAMAQYSGSDPNQFTTVYLDRAYGMGYQESVKELMVGYDCPAEALYLPATVHTAEGTTTRVNGICVFEREGSRPLSRHTGWGKNEMGATKGYELTVRSVSTVGNYDYFFDYTFQLDGTIEIRLSATGYLQAGWWDSNQTSFGHQIRDTTMGSFHDHIINYKIDFDIAGTKNSLMAVTLEQEALKAPWQNDDWGTEVNQTVIKRRMIKSEDGSRLNYPYNGQGAFVITNEDEFNNWGNPRGYAIHPGASNVHLANVDCKRTERNVDWAKTNLAVTRRHDNEPYSSSMWNIDLPGKPMVAFDNFFDGESLEQEDLVMWLNLGTHHIPRAEDSPHTLTNVATSNALLIPWNYNDFDPAMDSMNAILLQPPEPGSLWIADENSVSSAFCLPKKPAPFSYHGLVSYEEDGSLAKPATVWEQRNRNEKIHVIWAEQAEL